MKKFVIACVAGPAAIIATPAVAATSLSSGNVGSAFLFSPVLAFSGNTGTYSASNGGTFQVSATGDFANAIAGQGTVNGNIDFSKTIGNSVSQILNNLFVFADGQGGTFNFSGTEVQTQNFRDNPGVTTSGIINVFGSIVNSDRGVSATPSTLRIAFNSTGGSAFASSATLALGVPAPAVPEPATWAMMLLGFGMVGGAVRYRRRNTATTFA